MESVLSNFDINNPKNFWKLYPSFKTPKRFNELYNSDKSKDKKDSSLIMWALIHMFDKTEANPYREADFSERIEVINEDVLNDVKYKWDDSLIEYAGKFFETEEERTLREYLSYMEDRRKFLKEQRGKLTFDAVKLYDDAIKREAEIQKQLQALRNLGEQLS